MRDFLRGVPPIASLPISRTQNPYWDIIRTVPGNDIDWTYEHRWSPDWSAAYFSGMKVDGKPLDRHDLCGQYTWAIPDPDSLDFAARHLAPCAIEMGAGAGYWAWQLSQLGIDMLAYDEKPPHLYTDNHWHSPRAEHHGDLLGEIRPTFFPVQQGTPDILARYPERALLLCWPPYDTDMAAQCLKAYAGRKLVYIGEYEGGCTADEAFFAEIAAHWEEVDSHPIVQWWGINDVIQVYERKQGEAWV